FCHSEQVLYAKLQRLFASKERQVTDHSRLKAERSLRAASAAVLRSRRNTNYLLYFMAWRDAVDKHEEALQNSEAQHAAAYRQGACKAATLLQDEPCAPLTFRRGALLQLCWGAWRNSSAGKLLWTLRSVFRAHEAQSIVRTTFSAWKHECRTCQSLLRDEQSKVKFVRLCLAAAFFGWQLVSSASSFLRKVVQATADARCQAASVEVLSVVVKEWGVLTKEVRATPTQIKKAMLQQPDLFAILEAWKMLCAGSFASCSASCALLAFHKSVVDYSFLRLVWCGWATYVEARVHLMTRCSKATSLLEKFRRWTTLAQAFSNWQAVKAAGVLRSGRLATAEHWTRELEKADLSQVLLAWRFCHSEQVLYAKLQRLFASKERQVTDHSRLKAERSLRAASAAVLRSRRNTNYLLYFMAWRDAVDKHEEALQNSEAQHAAAYRQGACKAATLLQDEPCAPLTFRRGALLQLCWGAWRNSSAGKLLWTLRSVFRAHEAQSIVRTTFSAWKHECRTCQSLLRDEQSKVKFVRLCLAAAFFGWQLVSSASSFLRKVVQATADARCQAASVEVLSVVVKEWGVLTKEVRATPTQIKKAMLQQPDLFAILEAWKMLCAGSFASCSASCALLAFHKSVVDYSFLRLVWCGWATYVEARVHLMTRCSKATSLLEKFRRWTTLA
ncbi:unnamed protein product, partial [Durusdinium trenchii]